MTKPGAVVIEGHIQGLSNTRSLGEYGIPVFVVDKNNCIARYSRYCTKFFQCPDFAKDDFADFLIKLAVTQNIRDWVLLPSNDHAVLTLSKHKNTLEKYYKVITPKLEIIDKIYDKIKLIQIAKQINVPIPKTRIFNAEYEPLKQDLNFPVILKGRNGLSFYRALGRKALIAHCDEELRKQLILIKGKYHVNGTLIQELIPDNEQNKTISFTAFCDNGNIKVHWMGIKIREHPIRFGTATYAKSTYVEKCLQYSEKLLKELNYTGVCEVEYLRDPRCGEYKLIEMNPRTWLWVGLAKACGIDYAKLIYDYLLGIEIFPKTIPSIDKNWVNYLTDTIFSLQAIILGKIKLQQYINSFKGHNARAIYYLKDIKPVLMYFIFLPSFLKKR